MYKTYAEFDAAVGFSKKAGFQLSKMQVDLIEKSLGWTKLLNKAEVGCGKTVMSTVTSLMQGYDVSIVTCPPILITGWAKWLSQVSGGVVVYRGTPKERKLLLPDVSKARWVICSHNIFRDEFEILSQAVKRRRYELVIDEAHAIRNPKSQLFRKSNLLVSGDAGCQLLTGTPVSKPLDGYSYIKIKTPKVYRSYSHFECYHVAERNFFKAPVKFANLDMLADNLNLQTISATKEEMHGYNLKPIIPDCTYELDKEHYKLYQKLVDEQLLSFSDGTLIDASTSQKLRQAVQQIVVNWDYFSNDETKRSAAYDVLDQTVEEIEVDKLDKSKLIIWVQYKRTARSVLSYCNNLGIKTVAAYSEADTEKSVQAFLEDEKTRILVANPQSCGAGLNPQYVCSEALFLEMSTVPLLNTQEIGRICRQGQKKTPRLKFAVAAKTIQVQLLHDLMANDDLVQKISPTKQSIRAMLLGER